jgi:hypothetical protein
VERRHFLKKSIVFAGIGIDVPWHAPGTMQPFPSDVERFQNSIFIAMEAGAAGILASKGYDEVRRSSLKTFGI